MSRKRKRKKKRQKRDHSARKTRPSMPRRLLTGLKKAYNSTRKSRWAEAYDLLLNLNRNYPRRPEVLSELVNVCYELGDARGYQYACEQLVEVEPSNADAALGLAGSYLEQLHPILALDAFRRFIKRWPDHERAADVRETITGLEAQIPSLFGDLGVSPDDDAGWQLAVQHEEMQVHLTQGRFDQVRRTAQAILRRIPEFAPALNNISIAHWFEGHHDQAIAAAERVLTFDPENIHALSNLVHFLCAAGRSDQALPYANQLKASTVPAWDVWTKKAEALSFMGDDKGVLEVFRQAEQIDEPQSPTSDGLLYHLVAVSVMRLGKTGDEESEQQARRYWKQALKFRPGFRSAQQNLADLDHPVGERHAPWPFPLKSWISPPALDDLVRFIEKPERKDDGITGQEAQRFLRQHPEIEAMIPTLLERGNEQSRDFALLLARTAQTPQILETLKDFALSQHGPDQLRMEAAQTVSQAGLLPFRLTRMWLQGQWREIMMAGIEIHGQPLGDYSPHAMRLMDKAQSALRKSDGERAERMFIKALDLCPRDTSLLYNLAIAYNLQGRKKEADALIKQIHEQHPDYMFARIIIAQQYMEQDELDQARQLLEPLMERDRMHYSEFDAFCAAFIQLHLAEGNRDAARTWFEMWEQINPDNPQLEMVRRRLDNSSPLTSLQNRFLRR